MDFLEQIKAFYSQRSEYTDAEILADLSALPILPDEDSPLWDDDTTWEQCALFLALADQAASRKLEAAIPLLLERACYGDPGSTMRGLRHKLEAIVDPNWSRLTRYCIETAQSSHPGARLWAIAQLGVLRDPAAFPTYVAALADPGEQTCMRACWGLQMLCQTNVEYRERSLTVLEEFAEHSSGERLRHAEKAISKITKMDLEDASA